MILFMIIVVYENDCVYQDAQSSKSHEPRKSLWSCKRWFVFIYYILKIFYVLMYSILFGFLLSEILNEIKSNEPLKRKLFVVLSSDKGLCGGVHSALSKLVRSTIANPESNVDPDSPIVIIGDKSKAQLTRALPNNIVLTINQVGKDVPTFADATGVVDLINQTGVKYDSVSLLFLSFDDLFLLTRLDFCFCRLSSYTINS